MSKKVFPFGVYINSKTGKLKVFSRDSENGREVWILDSGMIKKHPIFRMSYPVVETMTPGWPLDDYGLRGYEYLGEL